MRRDREPPAEGSSPSRFSTSQREAWYIAAVSGELGREPLGRTILGEPLVFFRDGHGIARALEDRCAHRHVALSLGRVRRGNIECPYHGYQFDGQGRCVRAPSACPGEALPSRQVPRREVVEEDGTIWVWMGSGPPVGRPSWSFQAGPGYRYEEFTSLAECPMDLVLENGIDCSHTGFTHRGLLRDEPSRVVKAHVVETPTGVRVSTTSGRAESSLLFKIKGFDGADLVHTDELILPHTMRVDYITPFRHLVSVLIGTPLTASRTLITTRLYLRAPPFTRPILAFLGAANRKILAQDKRMLDNQGAQMERFGPGEGTSTAADVPSAWAHRALQAHARGEWPPKELRSRTVEYLL